VDCEQGGGLYHGDDFFTESPGLFFGSYGLYLELRQEPPLDVWQAGAWHAGTREPSPIVVQYLPGDPGADQVTIPPRSSPPPLHSIGKFLLCRLPNFQILPYAVLSLPPLAPRGVMLAGQVTTPVHGQTHGTSLMWKVEELRSSCYA